MIKTSGWSEQDLIELAARCRNGETASEMARRFGKTVGSIAGVARKLRLPISN